jgi:hypothetical protein
MKVTLDIPDEVAERLGGDLSRRALEAFVLAEYRAGRMYKPELRRLLGFSWHETEGFLKDHGVYEEVTIEDIRQQVKTLERLGV